jgi:hypothetical protein
MTRGLPLEQATLIAQCRSGWRGDVLEPRGTYKITLYQPPILALCRFQNYPVYLKGARTRGVLDVQPVSENGGSLLKNAYTDEICIEYGLHLRSDFDMHMQTDEIILSFSTGWVGLLRRQPLFSELFVLSFLKCHYRRHFLNFVIEYFRFRKLILRFSGL